MRIKIAPLKAASCPLRSLIAALGGAAVLGAAFPKARKRLDLSRAKHRSIAGHARMSRRIAGLIPFYEYDEDGFFRSDDAPATIVATRRDGFMRLSQLFQQRFAQTSAFTKDAAEGISDLQFISAYRVPFQYQPLRPSPSVGRVLPGVIVGRNGDQPEWERVLRFDRRVRREPFRDNDLDKDCIARGAERVRDLGPAPGSYHPTVAYNVGRLRAISGLDEVSFHMSGTEAVMQAVRLARYHTGRSHLVRFCGAYHGWWGDVQPGVGNPTPADNTYTLEEMSERTLHVLRTRRDIACVLVNPLQALHPNASAPADSSLVELFTQGRVRSLSAYTEWLSKLRAVRDQRGIVLIFDEIFVGFRLSIGGAKDYFGVQPDMITYGKTLGGGLPIGVRGAAGRR